MTRRSARKRDGEHTCHADCPCHAFYAAHQLTLPTAGKRSILRGACTCGRWLLLHESADIIRGAHDDHVRDERRKQPKW